MRGFHDVKIGYPPLTIRPTQILTYCISSPEKTDQSNIDAVLPPYLKMLAKTGQPGFQDE